MGTRLHDLKPARGAVRAKKRIGRGLGSGIGQQAGKGVKGQKARTGHHGAIIGFEGGQMPMQRRFPKRGFKNFFRVESFPINIGAIAERFGAARSWTWRRSRAPAWCRAPRRGSKVLGEGDVAKKLTVRAHAFSEKAPPIQAGEGRRRRRNCEVEAVFGIWPPQHREVPELRKRLLFTLDLPGGLPHRRLRHDRRAWTAHEMKNVISQAGSGAAPRPLQHVLGGALENLSIFALGIMPYVSASSSCSSSRWCSSLDELRKEGRAGTQESTSTRATATWCCRWCRPSASPTEPRGDEQRRFDGLPGAEVVTHAGWGFRLVTMLTLTTGTAFIMWIGEQITERGIGNGISLIIFAGIVDRPAGRAGPPLVRRADGRRDGLRHHAHRRHGDRRRGGHHLLRAWSPPDPHPVRQTDGRSKAVRRPIHAPATEINSAGVIPPIFAWSILLFPAQWPT